MSRDLLSIGEFARLSQLTVKALRFYDRKGLLAPAWIDPATGYRYYRDSQLARAERIRLLRGAEFPVAEVLLVLEAVGDADRRAVVERHRARLERRIDTLVTALAQVEHQVGAPAGAASLVELPAQRVLRIRERVPLASLGAAIPRLFGALFGFLGALEVAPAGPAMSIHRVVGDDGDYRDDLDTEVLPLELCVPASDLGRVPAHAQIDAADLPAGPALCATHRGSFHGLVHTRRALVAAARTRGVKLGGPPREVYHVSSYHTPDAHAWETEVVWPLASSPS